MRNQALNNNKAPYPFVVMAIDNPKGHPKGLYWYVVDSRKGSLAFNDRIGKAATGPASATYAHCHAYAMYRHHIEGVSITEAAKEYLAYWEKVRRSEDFNGVLTTKSI